MLNVAETPQETKRRKRVMVLLEEALSKAKGDRGVAMVSLAEHLALQMDMAETRDAAQRKEVLNAVRQTRLPHWG